MVSRFTLAFAFPLAVACAPVGGEGESAAPRVDSDVEGALFVAGKFGNTLSKVDLASGEQVVSVDSCANPHELATSPDDQHVALACYGGQTVDIFRTADHSHTSSIFKPEDRLPLPVIRINVWGFCIWTVCIGCVATTKLGQV